MTALVYLNLLVNDLPGIIDDQPEDVQENFNFQQDAAGPHTARIVTDHLNETYGGRWIGQRGAIPYPSRSPDLTPCDFWLWGHLKAQVYRERVGNIEQLQDRILEAVQNIPGDIIRRATHSVIRRVRHCIEQEGDNFEQFL